MSTEHEVGAFLEDFKIKMKMWGILIRDERGKNTQTLIDLEITRKERDDLLLALEVKDYSEGPLEETLYKGADMWVFGKMIKGKEVYIKITLGKMGSNVICISFHVAEYAMKYPLK
jgi:hypothetical protein